MLADTEMLQSSLTELRIYPSSTEIRQQYNAPKKLKMYFSREVFANILRGSLSIEGIDIESKQFVSKANNLDNQTVFVRRRLNEETQECRVIQADDLLLQDIKTKRYFRAQRHEIEYVNTPEPEGTEVLYVLKQQGKATLSYQIRGIGWSPQYDLNILSDDCRHTFQAFAEITNGTKQEYKIDRVELYGGDVLLQREVATKRRRNLSRSRSRSRSRSVSEPSDQDEAEFGACDLTPTIDTLGEVAGLYVYSIDQPFVLLSKSTFGLPFIQATVQISKCVGLSLPFTSHTQIRKLQRKYSIESIEKFLPGGPLTIREQGRLVGMTTLPDMAVGDKHTLNSGQDSDVSLNRQVKSISKERHSVVYAVELKFKNVKAIPMKFEYEEIIDSEKSQFKVIRKGSDDQQTQIQITSNGIQIGNDNSVLAANGGEQIYEYEIHLYRTTNHSSARKRRRQD